MSRPCVEIKTLIYAAFREQFCTCYVLGPQKITPIPILFSFLKGTFFPFCVSHHYPPQKVGSTRKSFPPHIVTVIFCSVDQVGVCQVPSGPHNSGEGGDLPINQGRRASCTQDCEFPRIFRLYLSSILKSEDHKRFRNIFLQGKLT